ncbi:hypothetical protein AB0953_17225 [Streptomyces sp. NPDC046866]|uniref:hypothetical protein n=1 Tax=Streptomyces sp. NPDC046866 TaxID=3154921 RepID=UPI0034539C0A
MKPAASPRRAHAPKPSPPRTKHRQGPVPAPAPRMDELCGAAEGTVPPSIVDLCVREYGR